MGYILTGECTLGRDANTLSVAGNLWSGIDLHDCISRLIYFYEVGGLLDKGYSHALLKGDHILQRPTGLDSQQCHELGPANSKSPIRQKSCFRTDYMIL